jgi:hypothetical protein
MDWNFEASVVVVGPAVLNATLLFGLHMTAACRWHVRPEIRMRCAAAGATTASVLLSAALVWGLLFSRAAGAQGAVGSVSVLVVVTTDVPRNVAFVPSLWSITQTQSQTFRVTLANEHPSLHSEPLEVTLQSDVPQGFDQLEIDVLPGCSAFVEELPVRQVTWSVGVLGPNEAKACDVVVRARANAVQGVRGLRAVVRVNGESSTFRSFFIQSPVNLVDADLSLSVTRPTGLSPPGTIQRIVFNVHNAGPDAHAPFSVAIGSYDLALTDQTPTPDPFRIIGTTDPACRFSVTTLGAGDPIVAFTNVALPMIPPGESRRCEVLVEILPSARGRSRSLPVILTHFGVGVVEADRLNNIGALQFTFTAEPVPTGSDRWLLPLAVLVLLAGLGFIRAQRRVA